MFFPARSALNGTSNQKYTLLELKVLTPAFYSSFVQYAHVAEAFDAEMLCASEEDRTIRVSKPELLPLIFPDSENGNIGAMKRIDIRRLDRLDRWRWSALRRLRSTPKRSSHSRNKGAMCTTRMTITAVDIRTYSPSPMDTFILNRCNPQNIRKYRRAVIKSLVSRRLAFGITDLLDLFDTILILFLAWVAAQSMQAALVPASVATSPLRAYSLSSLLNTNSLLTITICNSMHIWAYWKSIF